MKKKDTTLAIVKALARATDIDEIKVYVRLIHRARRFLSRKK